MKNYYEVVVSVLDKHGNRNNVINITGSNNKYKMLKERIALLNEIERGVYDKYKTSNTTLSADIEVRNDDTNELLYIM